MFAIRARRIPEAVAARNCLGIAFQITMSRMSQIEYFPSSSMESAQKRSTMKAVLLAGGIGSRIAEETHLKPKPMVEIGGKPVLWHILKIYSSHGVNDFVICLGYRGYLIKEYFANYFLHTSDVTLDLSTNAMEVHRRNAEPWRITLVDTGEATQTGGRLKRIAPFIDGTFLFTYGDGVSNVNVTRSIEFHRLQGRLATITAVQPAGRFGALDIEGQRITRFAEKPPGDGSWVNGGFFVIEPALFDLIADDAIMLEREPLERAASAGQLMAYRHEGFWHCMDTKRDHDLLEMLWASGAPWAV